MITANNDETIRSEVPSGSDAIKEGIDAGWVSRKKGSEATKPCVSVAVPNNNKPSQLVATG